MFFHKKKAVEIISSSKIPSPYECVKSDLNHYLSDLKKTLKDTDYKGSAFPLKYSFKMKMAWCNFKEAKEIICGLLEQEGWVVIFDLEDKDTIFIDLPRKRPEAKAPQ